MEKPELKNEKPKFYLLIHNIQSKKNIGTLLRSGSAFDISKVFLISKDNEKTKKTKIMKNFHLFFGAQGTAKKLSYEVFFSIEDAKEHFIKNKIKVCGIEITKTSKKVTEHPFEGNTCFILGNEGDGLHPTLKEICDYFVYIPHFTDKTASLNVAVAGSIVFHHFATWANYQQGEMYGEKFQNQSVISNKRPFLDCVVHPTKKVKTNINKEE